MKCFIIFVALVLAVQAEVAISESDALTAASQEKKQEKRGIGYNSLGGYSSTSGLGVDGTVGYYGGGVGGYNGALGVGGYNGAVGVGGYNGGYYSPYTPPRVAGLGSISGYTNPGYYSSGYNTGYNGYTGYTGYAGAGVGAGVYPGAYNSRLASPYYRQSYYNSYPSSYFNSNLGSSIVGGGLGLAGVQPTVPVVASGGYQYGPGISGGVY